ncbi:unnamed protein product [Closterium sp. NIES-53]
MARKKGGKRGDDNEDEASAESPAVELETKKGGKAARKNRKGRAGDDDDYEPPPDDVAAAVDDVDDEPVSSVKSKGKGKSGASGFAALMDAENGGAAEDAEEDEEEEEKARGGMGKGGKKAGQDEDDEEEARGGGGGGGKKGGKKGKKGKNRRDDFDDDFADPVADAAAEENGKPAAAKPEEGDSDGTVGPGYLVVGEIKSARKVKKADKLKACLVDIGGASPIPIVCGGTNVRAGLRVIVCPAGCAVPSTGAAVKKASIKGEESLGMICSRAEMGWADAASEVIELDASAFSVGDKAPLEDPNVGVGDVAEEAEDVAMAFTGKKKGKKGKGGKGKKAEEEEEESVKKNKKKDKKGRKQQQDEEEEAKEEVAEEEEEEEEEVVVSSKKASSALQLLAALGDEGGEEDEEEKEEEKEEEDEMAMAFSGKKKAKKGKKKMTSAQLDALMAEADGDAAEAGAQEAEERKEEEGGKGKKGGKAAAGEDDIDALLKELEAPKAGGGGGKKKKKEKEGKKKSGRTAEEEAELDRILAELDAPAAPPAGGQAPAADAKDSAAVEAAAGKTDAAAAGDASAEGEGEEEEAGGGGGGAESAAAKKKKKKKEKEKAAKAAAAAAAAAVAAGAKEEEAAAEGAGKAVDLKKLPKHVREMQERLARLKEAEEKRKREEEERERKEREEEERLAELERQREEAKQRRKQKEKEKKEQLKKEGKLLTGRQKEEAKRLAAMREQLLARTGGAEGDEGAGTGAGKKRGGVFDRRKKGKQQQQKQEAGGKEEGKEDAEEGDVEEAKEEVEGVSEVVEKVDEAVEEEKKEEEEEEKKEEKKEEKEEEKKEEEEEEEEEDWDTKSWDAEAVKIPKLKGAFDEEEEEEEEKVSASAAAKPAAKAKPADGASKKAAAAKAKGKAAGGKGRVEEESEEEEDSEEEDEDDDEESDEEEGEETRRMEARERREQRKQEAMKARSAEDLRSPICCILGHVDTGKTKLLDCIRRTNVQEGEAGGITQQIGATYFPMANIRERTRELKADASLRVPGLLVIDTPGHESFTNLRARGSGLCDIAILVVDLMHGLEPQTIESLNLLKMRKTPFVVAMNKVDRIYGWNATPNAPIRAALKKQTRDAILEFDRRTDQVMLELKEQGLNAALYYKNPDIRKFISIVPTSAISGEGVPDLLLLLVQLTQKLMEEQLMYVASVQCTVLEVKVIEGLGTTIDVVLVNGVLHEGDQIVVCGLQGPIVTSIRALLTPHPMKELRVKGSYMHHKELRAAQGIKITAQGLEHAVAGTQLYVVGPDDDVDELREEAMADVKGVLSRVDKSGEGVSVQASTLGSLEALLEFLKSPAVKIPVSGIAIGPVHKKDVMRASVMLERKKKEYAVILAFDVKVSTEAREMAEELGVRIFTADIIYHLFDQFTAYMAGVKDEKRAEAAEEAVFPVVLKIMPNCIFNKKDPIVLGVEVLDGIAKVGTPICVPGREFIDIGKIASMEKDHKMVDTAKKGQAVAMKIVGVNAEEIQKSYGRHFDSDDELVSRITRNSIDLLKENYRDDLSREDWILVVKLKKLFDIP